jgi:hypothetical protein
MTDLTTEAQSLIRSLGAPAQWHSVFIQTSVEDGQFVRKLCVSVRPGFENRVKVPETHMGHPVVNVPWPKES